MWPKWHARSGCECRALADDPFQNEPLMPRDSWGACRGLGDALGWSLLAVVACRRWV
jgi:hypothetical protein